MRLLFSISAVIGVTSILYSPVGVAAENLQQQASAVGGIATFSPTQQAMQKPSGALFPQQVSVHHNTDNQAITFQLKKVRIVDFFTDKPVTETLQSIVDPYLNRDITLSSVQDLSSAITKYYRDHNFLVARAIVPPQALDHGVLVIKVIKGKVGHVSLNNKSALSSQFVQRIANTSVASTAYLHQDQLEKFALLLNDIPGIVPNLGIQAGQSVGAADVVIDITPGKRYGGFVLLDNQGNKNTGRYRLSAGFKAQNLIGVGDEFRLDGTVSHTGDLLNVRSEFSALIDGYGTRAGGSALHLNYVLGSGDAAFKDLGAKGYTNIFGAYIQHPTFRTPNFRLNTRLDFTHQKSVDQQTQLHLRQDRQINKVSIAVLGSVNSIHNGVTQFSLGFDFGRENNQSNEKSQNRSELFTPRKSFTVVHYGISHEQILPYSLTARFTWNGQYADRNLDSSQKMPLGGRYAVRGYSSNDASVDNGQVWQLELQHTQAIFQQSILSASVFYDLGLGQYNRDTRVFSTPIDHNHVTLQSVGVGLNLSAPNSYAVDISYAHPIGKRLSGASHQQFWLSVLKTF